MAARKRGVGGRARLVSSWSVCKASKRCVIRVRSKPMVRKVRTREVDVRAVALWHGRYVDVSPRADFLLDKIPQRK